MLLAGNVDGRCSRDPRVGNEGRLGRASSHCALHLGVNSKDENPLFESSFPGYDGSIFVKGG